jgi:hypothetical protein
MPTDFSHSSTRKARFFAMFNQYEDEINRLIKQIDTLNNEIKDLKVCYLFFCSYLVVIFFILFIKDPSRFITTNSSSNSDSPQKDMVQLLKIKLEQLQSNYDEIIKDRDKFKEVRLFDLNSKIKV